MHSHTIKRLNALASRWPHSIFWKHQYQSWNTYIFLLV